MATINVLSARNNVDHAAERKPAESEAARLLIAVRNLAPELAARAEEIEAGRRGPGGLFNTPPRSRLLPGDIVNTLRRIGIYRMLVPRSHGGLELSVPDVVPVLEALSAAESSV